MVGLLLVSHGKMAESILDVAQQISGESKGVQAVGMVESRDEKELMEKIRRARREIDHGKGVLILTDMFGGTPCDISLSLLEEGKVEVLSGMNLPMVLKILSSREEKNLTDLAIVAMESGRNNINLAGQILKQKVPGS